jgi:NAD-dependent dihydropyrimidine dehydrogenase PreA subunit
MVLKGGMDMRIDENLCIGCETCIPYCPMGCIKSVDGQCVIELDECVECSICQKNSGCPVDAFYEGEWDEFRELRKQFSNPLITHPTTGVPGRGTEEMKTNEVTGRFKRGFAGIAIELGRPGTGTRFHDVEKVAKAVAEFGVEFEEHNPVTKLMSDRKTGEIDKKYINLKTLSAIVEFGVPEEMVVPMLKRIKEVSTELETVFSLDLCARTDVNGNPITMEWARAAGFEPYINGKVNVGLGRPLKGE